MGTTTQYPVERIAILGANGQIGSLIHQYLRSKFPKVQILACVRELPTCEKQYHKDYIIFHPFADSWQVLGEVDVLINCIGIIEENKGFTFKQVHLELTKLILKNRQIIGNPKVIQLSALGADASSLISFLSTKGKADELLLADKNTVIIRPSIVCTPDTILVQKLRILTKIANYLFKYLPVPDSILFTQIQPIMPEDLVELVANTCIMNAHPAIIPAVGPSPVSIQELILQVNKGKIHIVKVPQTLIDLLIPLSFLVFPGFLSKAHYQLLQQNNTANTLTAETVLGRKLLSTSSFWKNQIVF